MPVLASAATWVAMVVMLVPLALLLLMAIPTGAIASIAMHAVLLVVGAAIVLALRPDTE